MRWFESVPLVALTSVKIIIRFVFTIVSVNAEVCQVHKSVAYCFRWIGKPRTNTKCKFFVQFQDRYESKTLTFSMQIWSSHRWTRIPSTGRTMPHIRKSEGQIWDHWWDTDCQGTVAQHTLVSLELVQVYRSAVCLDRARLPAFWEQRTNFFLVTIFFTPVFAFIKNKSEVSYWL